jgi:disulfide bond formation protein DsbB
MITWLLFNIQLINTTFAIAGLALLALTIVLTYDYCYGEQKWFTVYLQKWVWLLIIITTWGGVASTLLYSEVFGFVPCSLCWLQRVALYPQALLSIVAYRINDTQHFSLYGIWLSAFGFLVAVYQYIYQAIPAEVRESGGVFCLADGSADCAKKIMEVFGFVTFPFLSAVLFLFLIILFLHLKKATN